MLWGFINNSHISGMAKQQTLSNIQKVQLVRLNHLYIQLEKKEASPIDIPLKSSTLTVYMDSETFSLYISTNLCYYFLILIFLVSSVTSAQIVLHIFLINGK